MSNKQSSIEWLQEQYNLGNGFERHLTESDFEEAKAMHKQEIIDAYYGEVYYESNSNGEQYYNETFE